MAGCLAAGAAGFVDKYNDDFGVLAQAVDEIGHIVTGALRKLARKCRDVRLSDTLEETPVLLEQDMKDVDITKIRCLSAKTIEDHKRKILAAFGDDLEARVTGFANLTCERGIAPGNIVDDRADIVRAAGSSRGPCPGAAVSAIDRKYRARPVEAGRFTLQAEVCGGPRRGDSGGRRIVASDQRRHESPIGVGQEAAAASEGT